MNNEIEKEEYPQWEAPTLIMDYIDMTEVPKDPTDTEALSGQVS
jgi:hypothetical protein